jgi:hypothetical protein
VSKQQVGSAKRASTGQHGNHQDRLDDLWTEWIKLVLGLELEAVIQRRLAELSDHDDTLIIDGRFAPRFGARRFRPGRDYGVVAFLQAAICSACKIPKLLTSGWCIDRFARNFLLEDVRERCRSSICSVWRDLKAPDEQASDLLGSRSKRRTKKPAMIIDVLGEQEAREGMIAIIR